MKNPLYFKCSVDEVKSQEIVIMDRVVQYENRPKNRLINMLPVRSILKSEKKTDIVCNKKRVTISYPVIQFFYENSNTTWYYPPTETGEECCYNDYNNLLRSFTVRYE